MYVPVVHNRRSLNVVWILGRLKKSLESYSCKSLVWKTISIPRRPREHLLRARHYAPGKEMQGVKRRGFGDALRVPPCDKKLLELKVGWGHPGQVLWSTARGKQYEGALGEGTWIQRNGWGDWGREMDILSTRDNLSKGHVESTPKKLSVAPPAGGGHGEKSGGSRKNDQESRRAGLGADDK